VERTIQERTVHAGRVQTEESRLQHLVTKAQVILEYLKATSYDKNSGLLTDETMERRERLGAALESIIQDI